MPRVHDIRVLGWSEEIGPSLLHYQRERERERETYLLVVSYLIDYVVIAPEISIGFSESAKFVL